MLTPYNCFNDTHALACSIIVYVVIHIYVRQFVKFNMCKHGLNYYCFVKV